MMKKVIDMKRWILLLMVFWPYWASADTASMTAQIERILNSNSDGWGGCMVKLNKGIRAETGLDCDSSWVTFSCSGEYAPKDQAYKMYDTAQLAMVMGYDASLHLDDQKKHSGYCLVWRIDVIK